MPEEAEVHALLGLMLMNDARRDARYADAELVLLRDQDRSLWDEDQIAAGRAALERALERGLELTEPGGELAVLPTYTAMLGLRAIATRRGLTRPYWES